MILVSIFVFAFLLGYLRLFARGNRLKMISTVTAFSLLVSFLVSYLTVSSSCRWHYNPALTPRLRRLSMPFYLDGSGISYGEIGTMWYWISFADIQIWEGEFGICSTLEGSYIYPRGQVLVDYTDTLFNQFILMFIGFNIIGVSLATLTHVCLLKIWRLMKKLKPRVMRAQQQSFPYRSI